MKWTVPGGYRIKFRAYDLYTHSIDDGRREESWVMARQPDDEFGYFNVNQFALTSSNTFIGEQTITGSIYITGSTTQIGNNTFTGNQTINGSLTINGDINANQFIVTTSSVNHFTASTNFGLDDGDTHTFTGSVRITGSLNTIGSSTITGSFLVSGSTTQIGNNTLQGNTLLSGTIGITGNSTLTGSFLVTGSTTQIGNNTLLGNTILSGSVGISGSTIQQGNNTLLGNTILSGSIGVSGSMDVHGSTNFHNHTITMTGSMYTSGSQSITGSLDVKGNINVASGSEFYLAGNKLFNYGQFSDTTTQSGSADTAYSMKLNTIDFAHEVTVANQSRITPANTGIYNLQFSAQLTNTANTNLTFDVWLAYTGSNVANTNTQVDVNKSAGQLGRSVAAWNWMLPIRANDYVEIMWSCNGSTGQILALGTQSNPTRPAIPSVIATLTQIG